MGVVVAPKLLTLVMVLDQPGRRILLGKKKRGFGAGYFNGFGGKVEAGETVSEGAARELREEAGVSASDARRCGVLHFHFDDNPQPWEVHCYTCSAEGLDGVPVESDEMAPEWFPTDAIPYDRMWADDPTWYPLMLAGKLFEGEFHFTQTTTLVRGDATEVDELPPPTGRDA